MNKKLLVITMCLGGCFKVGAQVEFMDPNSVVAPVDESQRWAHMNVNRPYDSTAFIVSVWPTIEAYKKYVGQTFFLLAQRVSRSKYYIHNMYPQCSLLTNDNPILLGAPLKKDKYRPYKNGKLADIVNKYYTIVDVVKYLGDDGKPLKRFAAMKQPGYRVYTYPCRDLDGQTCTSNAEVPVFVLVEQTSGDTCYTANPEDFLIVGSYVKVQNDFQNARLNYTMRKVNKNDKERWNVVKVAIATREFYDYPDYEGKPTMAFIIQNNKGIQKAIPVKEYVNMKWWTADEPQPESVNEALSKKKVAEQESACCNDLVKELDDKYAGTKEMQEMIIPSSSPAEMQMRTLEKPPISPEKKTSSKNKMRRPI